MRNLQEQVKKAFCYQKLFWPLIFWIDCSSGLKNFANSCPSTSNSKSFSRSLEQFFLTVDQNNFGNKIPFFSYARGKITCQYDCINVKFLFILAYYRNNIPGICTLYSLYYWPKLILNSGPFFKKWITIFLTISSSSLKFRTKTTTFQDHEIPKWFFIKT